MRTMRIIGPGRVGRSLAAALGPRHSDQWEVVGVLGRTDDPAPAAEGVDLLVIATPDDTIAAVAAAVRPCADAVVAHCAGSLTLDVLRPHPRRGSLHPLASLPDAETGAERLRDRCAFAVEGDPLVSEVVAALGGRAFEVHPEHRTRYHAAAALAANHLVALMGQVERVAAPAGVPLEAYLDLARQTLENVARLGPADALTGPVARGDWDTVARHLEALDPADRPAYEAMAQQAARLRPVGAAS